MERLWISNIAPGTSDDELTALVKKYAPDLALVKIERVEGDGSRPAALLSFTHEKLDSTSPEGVPSRVEAVISHLDRLNSLSQRLNGMYWKGHMLSSSTTVFVDNP